MQVTKILALDQAGAGWKIFRMEGLVETLLDPGVWMLLVLTILIAIPSGVITTFSATVIYGFGCGSEQASSLNMPSTGVWVNVEHVSSQCGSMTKRFKESQVFNICAPKALLNHLPQFPHARGQPLHSLVPLTFHHVVRRRVDALQRSDEEYGTVCGLMRFLSK